MRSYSGGSVVMSVVSFLVRKPGALGFSDWVYCLSVQPSTPPHMTSHPYLQHGLSIFHARLKSPLAPIPHPVGSHPPFITLSHETCAGATTVAHHLLPLLNEHVSVPGRSWILLEKDLISQALDLHHLPARLADYLPEDRRSEIKGLIGEMIGLHPPLWELEHQVAEAILKLARLGCVILSGRAAHQITRGLPGGVHLRLVAPLECRIQRAQQMLGCMRDAPSQYVRDNDSARERHLQTQFELNINDAHLYDVIINTERITADHAARIGFAAVQEALHPEAVVEESYAPVASRS